MYSFTTREYDPADELVPLHPRLCTDVMLCVNRCRDLIERYHFSIVIVQIVITTFVVSNFTLATFMDPGVIPKGELTDQA